MEFLAHKVAEGAIGPDLLGVVGAFAFAILALLVYLRKKKGWNIGDKVIEKLMVAVKFLHRYKPDLRKQNKPPVRITEKKKDPESDEHIDMDGIV